MEDFPKNINTLAKKLASTVDEEEIFYIIDNLYSMKNCYKNKKEAHQMVSSCFTTNLTDEFKKSIKIEEYSLGDEETNCDGDSYTTNLVRLSTSVFKFYFMTWCFGASSMGGEGECTIEIENENGKQTLGDSVKYTFSISRDEISKALGILHIDDTYADFLHGLVVSVGDHMYSDY
jgi:hypothetical protein